MKESFRLKIIPGCLGSLVMECVRLYKIHILGVQSGSAASGKYLWLSALFILSGGIVAYYWDDKNEWRSFVMGLSWPALIAAFSK